MAATSSKAAARRACVPSMPLLLIACHGGEDRDLIGVNRLRFEKGGLEPGMVDCAQRKSRLAGRSAGILMYRRVAGELLVLLAHPGGPFWRRKDVGAWSIPKGEIEAGEDAEAAARREFAEETGLVPRGALHPLGSIRQRSGKIVEAFAMEGDFDIDRLRSAMVEISWPPRSGLVQSFPEIDRVGWFALPVAREKILAAQAPFLDRLENLASA